MEQQTIYTPTLEHLHNDVDVTDIYYVNSYPGAGKTYAALNAAQDTLHNGNHANYVLVYAAPTHILLEQFRDDLTKRVGSRQMKNVHIVGGDKGPTVEKQFDGLINSLTDGSLSIKKVPNGSVILVTHQCLTLVRRTMSGKGRISLIFDEARQCMQTSMSMRVPTNVMNTVMNDYIVINEALSNQATARWSWAGTKRLDESKLRSMWEAKKPPKKTVDNFVAFLEHVRNGTLHVWVSLDDPDPAAQEFQVNVTLSPSRLFFGYGKVLILSAFFEHSQMYHLLKRQEVDLSTPKGRRRLSILEPHDRVHLINVTDQLIDHDRVTKIADARLSKALLTYVFDGESFGKFHMQRGVVIPKATPARLNALSVEYQQLFDAEDHKPGTKPETYKKFWSLVNNTDERVQLRSTAYARRDFMLALNPSPYSVVQYLALASSQIQRAWLAHNGFKNEPLLLCLNTKEYRNSRITLWKQEQIDELLNSKVNAAGKLIKRVKRVPMISQGMNKWDQHNTAAFMATVKLTPAQIKFLKALLPGYDPDLDRTVDQCIQFVFRSAIRNAEASSCCLLIVSDRKLATQVNRTLGEHLRMVAPSEIVKRWKPRSVAVFRQKEDADVKAARDKKYKSTEQYKEYNREYNRKLTETEYGREYRRLSQIIYRREARLKTDPTNSELITEIGDLKFRRSQLTKHNREIK